MNDFLDFIEKHKFAIIGTLLVHVGIFIYFQIRTFPQDIYYTRASHLDMKIQADEEVIELKPENILPMKQSEEGGPIKNITKNENDSRKSSVSHYSKSSIDKQVEEDLKNFESESFKEFGKGRPQNTRENTFANKTQTTKNQSQKTKESQANGDGIKTQVKGVTMVSYNLSGRYPHNNNDWYIRNPGYTCETNITGKVVVDISVNQAGEVTEAKVNTSQSSGASECMLEKARSYALQSRFAYKSTAPFMQKGTITYRFVAK